MENPNIIETSKKKMKKTLKALLPLKFSSDIVIRVHKSFYRNDFNQIKSELESLIVRLIK